MIVSNSIQELKQEPTMYTSHEELCGFHTYSDLKNPFHANPQQQCIKHTAKTLQESCLGLVEL